MLRLTGDGEFSRLRALPGGADNRRFGWLSALRAHTKAPHKMEFSSGNAKGA